MSKGLTIAILGILVVLALGVGGLGYYVIVLGGSSGGHVAEAAEPEAKKEADSKYPAELFELKLTKFTTDLADKDRQRYTEVTISLTFPAKEDAEAAKKLESMIRNTVLTVLRDRKAADLSGAEGKQKLIEALVKPLKEQLPKLKEVFVTDLIVQ